GNAVDSAREHLTNANGSHGVNRPACASRVLDCEDGFRGRTESIPPIGHQDAAGMSAAALDGNPQAGRSSDFRNYAQRHPVALQEGALLNVEFHECFVIATWQFHILQVPLQVCCAEDRFQRRTITVCELSCSFRSKTGREQAAAKTSDAKARRFF